jgi:hypothetical protein
MNDKILLVEGVADEGFFSAVCRIAGLGVKVKVSNPILFGGGGTGKGNALKVLPFLIDQMRDGRIGRLAMVVDADYNGSNGLGFQATVNKIAAILKDQGYKTSLALKPRQGGYYFTHSDGLSDFGLWVMPNNQNDGFIEDFIKGSIAANQKTLLAEAVASVGKLKAPLFQTIHRSKADVATWMAWQKVPGQALHGVVGGKSVDFTSGVAKELMDWMNKIYS